MGKKQGLRKLRGTTAGTVGLRQLVEKRLESQGNVAIRFMDLKKAFDTVPRGVVMATVRWVGMPEAEAKIVERMYERTMGRD